MLSLPDALLPKKKYFGLSIERSSIHAVELDDKNRPVKSVSIQMPHDTFAEGRLTNRNAFLNAVRTVMAKGKFSTPYVAVCSPEVFAYTRGCIIPQIPLDEVQEAISWKSRELFPFPEADIYYDWKLLRSTEKEIQTIVVAIQRKIPDDLVGALVEIGLKPLRFEPDASALVRLLKIGEDKHALLVEINPKGAYITLVEGEKAVFTTVINNSTQDTPTTYLANIDQSLLDIAAFYKNKGELPDNTTQVIITGEMASNNWAIHLGQILKYPASLLKTPVSDQSMNKAYAAAVQKIAPPTDEQSINLLPTATQSFYDAERNMQFYKTMLIRFGIFIMVVDMIAAAAFIAAKIQRQSVDNNVKAIRKLTQSQQSDTQALLLLNAQAKNITLLSPLRKTPKAIIRALSDLNGDNIVITGWEYDDTKLSFKISGSAQTRMDLLNFRDSLDKSDEFIQVTLPLEALEQPVNVTFVMTLTTKK